MLFTRLANNSLCNQFPFSPINIMNPSFLWRFLAFKEFIIRFCKLPPKYPMNIFYNLLSP